jgi:ribosomal protein S13
VKLPGLLDVAGEHVRTDIPRDVMMDLALHYSGIDRQKIKTVENHAYWDSRKAATIIPDDQLAVIRQTLRHEMHLP